MAVAEKSKPVQEMERRLLGEIPLTQQMQLRLQSLSLDEARWSAPLGVNHNHLGTVFGGSLYAASALACYSLLLHKLAESGIPARDIVIAEGDIRYLQPAKSDFQVRARLSPDEDWERFLRQLRARGRARIQLEAESDVEGNGPCSRFSGRYVVLYTSG